MNNQLRSSDIFTRIPDLKYLPRWVVLLLDVVLCLGAFLLSLFLGETLFHYDYSGFVLNTWQATLILLIVQILGFYLFHTYSGIIRFSTFVDMLKVLSSLLLCTIVVLVANLFIQHVWHIQLFSNTAVVLYFPMAFLLLFGFRVTVKTTYDTLIQHSGASRNVMIYGTKNAGLAIAKMLRSSANNTEYRPVAFITDGKDMKSFFIQGLPVYSIDKNLLDIMKRKNVRDIIVSPLKMKEINPAVGLEFFLKNNIHILTTDSFTTWDKDADEHDRIVRIENIQIEDLLERPVIDINTDNVSKILTKKVVLVTGAAGSIGSEMVRQILKYHPSLVILFEQAESPLHDLYLDLRNLFPQENILPIIGDVRDDKKLDSVFADYHPDVVFHAAAYKHVPLMEDFPNEAVRANVLGTKNVADLSVKYNVSRFVMISTDKAVNPTNVMGASKRIAEIYVQSLFRKLQKDNPNCTKFITTRFGNVLGSNGSVIPYFKKQIAAGGPVTVTHPDIIRFFMTIPEACTLVLEAATLGEGGEIFVFDMGQPVKIIDLARNMIRLAGFQPDKDIQITFTGLRPGEKLYEEVLNQKEVTLPTANSKIMIARIRESDYDTVLPQIVELIGSANTGLAMNTVALMKRIVPEYKSKNSIYEQLDR